MSDTKSDPDRLKKLENQVQNLKDAAKDLKEDVAQLKRRGDQWPG